MECSNYFHIMNEFHWPIIFCGIAMSIEKVVMKGQMHAWQSLVYYHSIDLLTRYMSDKVAEIYPAYCF